MSDQNDLIIDDEEEETIGWGLGWAFWIQWILANAVGWSFSNMVRQAIIEAGGSDMNQVVTGVAIGLCLGFGQWIVLLQQPYKTGLWWILATIAGWGFGWAIGWRIGWGFFSSFGFGVVFGTIGVVAGTLVGISQWAILRGQVQQAGWWILTNTIGWSIGLILIFTVARSFGLGWAVASGVAGAITGGPLIWLLRRPITDTA